VIVAAFYLRGGSGNGRELSQGASGIQFIGQTGSITFGQSLAAGTWTHLAVTFTAGTIRAYVNGVQIASSAYTAANSLTDAVGFGDFAGCGGGEVWLDELQLRTRVS